MPLRIEREDLWKRLATRFKARIAGEEDEGYPVILDTLQPVTDFDELAKEQIIAIQTMPISGVGSVLYWTVPKGERWTLKVLRVAQSTGDYTFTQVLLASAVGSIPILQVSASTDELTMFEGQEIVAIEGWTISVYFDAGTSPGNVTARLLYDKEDAF